MVKIRPEIQRFAEQMEIVMERHDWRKGNSWQTMRTNDLRKLLLEEHNEWMESLNLPGEEEELLDVANLSMMLWNRLIPDVMPSPSPRKDASERSCDNCDHQEDLENCGSCVNGEEWMPYKGRLWYV